MKIKPRIIFWGLVLCALVCHVTACNLDMEIHGDVITYAGLSGTPGNNDANVITGSASDARFNRPQAMAVYGQFLFVGDSGNNSVRMIHIAGDTPGHIETLITGLQGDIRGLAVNSQHIVVSDHHAHQIKIYARSGGSPIAVYGSGQAGFRDGPGDNAMFNYPSGVALNAEGIIFIADTANSRLRRIDSQGNVSTVAGSAGGFADGQGTGVRFEQPVGLVIDGDGNFIIADTWNHFIRMIDTGGNSGTYASYRGSWGFQDGESGLAKMGTPQSLFLDDATGDIYFTDGAIPAIRKITPGRLVEPPRRPGEEIATGSERIVNRFIMTIAGFKGFSSAHTSYAGHGYRDGSNIEARFNNPFGVAAIVSRGNTYVFVADTDNHVIRRIARNNY